MEEQQIQREPKYFIAVFGKMHAKEHPIYGGLYPINSSYGDAKEIAEGDIMLVYCTKFYEDIAGNMYDKESPGIGKVNGVEKHEEQVYVHYDYESFDTPIERAVIMDCLAPDEKNYFINPGLKHCWLRKIKRSSFQCILQGRVGNRGELT